MESREAIPKLAAWLEERHGVTFLRETAVRWRRAAAVGDKFAGRWRRRTIVVCPGDDFHTLHADRLAAYGLTRCKLHMMRLKPERYDARLPVVMSDLGLVRYLGYAELPPAAALRARLEAEQGRATGAWRAPDRRPQRRRLAGGRRFPPLRRDAGPVRARLSSTT